MNAAKEPPIVAELGRPETPQEAADRRAAASLERRQHQTLFNLVIALLACLAVVAVLVLLVVRPEAAPREPVDYRTLALQADAPIPLAAPELPDGWYSNSAIYSEKSADGVANWYVGFITPTDQFIALRQGIDANPTWLAQELDGMRTTGSTTIDGVEWSGYDHRAAKDAGNHAFAMSTVAARSTFVLYGTASSAEFEFLAEQLATTITTEQ